MNFGVLTLATSADYQKAIGLALSLRVSNPGTPVAVACSPKVRPLVASYFDYTIDENPALTGFVHKLHLDRYSPFDETFFFDSDVLVFKTLGKILDRWRVQPYSACGEYVTGGVSPFGLDRVKALKIVGKQELVHIDGAGHAYFRRPECETLFEVARKIAADYQKYTGGPIKFADEDVIDIAMTILGLKPMPRVDFWSRYCSGKPGSVKINAAERRCNFVSVDTGQIQRPYMMHFVANEAPFVYRRQLKYLFEKFHVSTKGLLSNAVESFYLREIKWPLKALIDGFSR
jgi:hypothetical protein